MDTRKNPSNHRKHRYRQVGKSKKQSNRVFIDKEFGIKVIIDCGKTAANKFRTSLVFKHNDAILLPTKTKMSLEGGNMQTEYSKLLCRTDLCLQGYKIAAEIGERGHSDKNIEYKTKKKKRKNEKR